MMHDHRENSRFQTTFPTRGAFNAVDIQARELGLHFDTISPDPGYALVGCPSLVMDSEARTALCDKMGTSLPASGWVDFRAPAIPIPGAQPPEFAEDVFGRASMMFLAPCMADPTRIRLIAHISGDLSEAFPYMNSVMKQACYNKDGPTFTYQDGYRMISVYPRRIAVAKADEIVDAWRVLESLRVKVNETWARRAEIEPDFRMREKPPALEILKRLPRNNCRACGELTCLAFAVKVRSGEVRVSMCEPVFGGEHARLKDALVEIVGGLGLEAS